MYGVYYTRKKKGGNICLVREEDNESNNGPPNEHSHENANPCMIVYINCKLLVAYIVLLVYYEILNYDLPLRLVAVQK